MRTLLCSKRSVIVGLLTLCTSCTVSKPIYTNAAMGSIGGYVAKPEYNGENESAIFLSGEYGNANVSSDGEKTGNTIFGSLNAHRAHTHKNFNLYYGVGARLGTFKFEQENFSIEDGGFISAGKKNFYAIQAKAGINYLVSRPFADFRILGLDFGYINEFGPYQNTLNEIKLNNLERIGSTRDLKVFSKPSNFYVGLSSEIIFKMNKKNSIGINPFAARSFLESKSGLNPNLYGLTLSYRYSDFTLSFFNEINSQYGVDAYTCKFGLSYKLY